LGAEIFRILQLWKSGCSFSKQLADTRVFLLTLQQWPQSLLEQLL
jgi:hypothetical protein